MHGLQRNQGLGRSGLKAVMVGYYGVGKSAILCRFGQRRFEEEYQMTLGASQASRLFQLQGGVSVRLQLIDTPGGGFVREMVSGVMPECEALLLVYDITNEESFYRVCKWYSEMGAGVRREVLLVLVGTHLDQPYKRKISEEQAGKWSRNNGFGLWFEVSAKTNENVMDLFEEVCRQLLIRQSMQVEKRYTDDMNPETSTTFEEEKGGGCGVCHRVVVLEKRLSFKEMECSRLWGEYEQALRRIGELEGVRERGESNSSNLFGSFKEWSSDSEQWQLKVRGMEESRRVMEEYYVGKQNEMEEMCSRKVREGRAVREELQLEIGGLNELAGLQVEMIGALERERDELLVRVNSVVFDLEEKGVELSRFENEVKRLCYQMEDRTLFLEEVREVSSEGFEYRQVADLHLRFEKMLIYLEQKQRGFLKKEVQLQAEISQKQRERQTLEEEVRLLGVELGRVEQSLREEVSNRVRVEVELRDAMEVMAQNEQSFNRKVEEQDEVLFERQSNIKLLVENVRMLQDNLDSLGRQYSSLSGQLEEKNRLLAKKEELLGRVVGEKVNEIQQLKGFIEELGKNSKNIVEKYSKTLGKVEPKQSEVQCQAKKGDRTVEFFEDFLEKVNQKSVLMVQYFEQMLRSFQEIHQSFAQLKQYSQELQITEYVFDCKEEFELSSKQAKLARFREYVAGSEFAGDEAVNEFAEECQAMLGSFREWQFALWQNLRGESTRRVSRLVSGLLAQEDRLASANEAFGQSIGEIQESIRHVEDIKEMGVRQYIKEYFD